MNPSYKNPIENCTDKRLLQKYENRLAVLREVSKAYLLGDSVQCSSVAQSLGLSFNCAAGHLQALAEAGDLKKVRTEYAPKASEFPFEAIKTVFPWAKRRSNYFYNLKYSADVVVLMRLIIVVGELQQRGISGNEVLDFIRSEWPNQEF